MKGMEKLPNVALVAAAFSIFSANNAFADSNYYRLSLGSFMQDWSNPGLFTANDDWSGVASIMGYRGDDLSQMPGVDPQTVVSDSFSTVIDININQTSPDTFTTGGVTHFTLANPVVALSGSTSADSPNLVLYLDLSGMEQIEVSYLLRDIDGSADNAIQSMALQYRIGSSGDFTNLPAAFVANASSGPNLAILATPVSLTLPAAVENQSEVQLRFITTNAAGNDEWIGVDDIQVSGRSSFAPVPEPSAVTSLIGGIGVLYILRRRTR